MAFTATIISALRKAIRMRSAYARFAGGQRRYTMQVFERARKSRRRSHITTMISYAYTENSNHIRSQRGISVPGSGHISPAVYPVLYHIVIGISNYNIT
jgi:hypothetical protein